MSTTFRHEGAKIYEFPRKLRTTAGEQRRESQSEADFRPRPIAAVEFGSGWYHEAAVQDAERNPKP